MQYQQDLIGDHKNLEKHYRSLDSYIKISHAIDQGYHRDQKFILDKLLITKYNKTIVNYTQDNYKQFLVFKNNSPILVVIICDGHGGETASMWVTREIFEHFQFFINKSKHIIFEKIAKNRSIIEKIEKIYGRDFDLLGYKKLDR